MAGRRATDGEVAAWQQHGWVLLDGLIDPAEIDVLADELGALFPTPAEYHADPAATRAGWLGGRPDSTEQFLWPETGPGFRAEQHRWHHEFPLPGSPRLNRLFIHPAVVDFARRALGDDDIRIYQMGVNAKYTGEANYEQPMHTDRNHSWLPARPEAPWWHVQAFLYLSDVTEGLSLIHI